MSSTIAPRRSLHPSRRALLVVSLAATLVVGGGAVAAVSLASSDGASGPRANPAPAVATNVDAEALWNQLSTLTANQRDDAVAGLTPDVRAQLRDIALDIALAAEHQ